MDYEHQAGATLAPKTSQTAESFLLSPGAEQSLPQQAQVALRQVDNLKYFLISGPVDWIQEQNIKRFLLPTGEYVSCILWNNLFHITGTDIVRCLAFRFQAFGRPVKNTKKFEEGIFSDLRNLKSGSDASLEEPKSPFLDYLYKNNCIRTQKKQKVFFWYSVPHDRLFLDALERDLKREKAAQEPTTIAVAEPALSFEFDASQSLFDQLTKAQQENSGSIFNIPQETYSQSASPVVRAADAMPPPPIMSNTISYTPQETFNDQSSFSQMTMPGPAMSMTTPTGPAQAPHNMMLHEHRQHLAQAHHHAQPQVRQPIFDRYGNPLPHIAQRQASLPAYHEYSPAPSFVSSQSHQEDYTGRGVSYEPITPPQQSSAYATESISYIPDGDAGLYGSITEQHHQHQHQLHHHHQEQCIAAIDHTGQQYIANPAFPVATVLSSAQSSPHYKQRRRTSSAASTQHAVINGGIVKPYGIPRGMSALRRPSDLRRSVSASAGLNDGSSPHRSASIPPNTYQHVSHYQTPDISRHSTPVRTVEARQQSLPLINANNGFTNYIGDSIASSPQEFDGSAEPLRRARSVTTTELFSPYSQKQHSCPIPGCGRLFKRLEHLKRHVRTHTQEKPYVCPQCNRAFSRSDNLAQHRRTHEDQGVPDVEASFEEADEADDAHQLASLDEEDMGASDASFHTMNGSFDSYGGMMPSGNHGSMGPPLMPASAMMAQTY